jgi:pimeloyl-ACP methyl ester carboxylesterase
MNNMERVPVLELPHPGGYVANPVLTKGQGKPLVFLHGLFGQEWGGFLDDLAVARKVYAPAHAGSVDLADLETLDGLWDLLVYYDDLFASLRLDRFDLVGHSFGGMVAAEFAAMYPERIGKLVLIDALGLWNDNYPVADHLLSTPAVQTAMRFHNLENAAVAQEISVPTEPDKVQAALVKRFLALSSTSQFIHPIPDRGLRKRLRRIKAETLIIWGAEDRLTPRAYADDFVAGIKGARQEIIADAGHTPQLEQRNLVSERVRAFLD